jgi:Spy/CpxP family protein refolding chaperone
MSRTYRWMFACLGVAVICTLAASCASAADDPPANPPARQRGQGGRGGGGDLTTNDKVQADLQLSDEQKESIKKLADKAREDRAALTGLSQEDRRAKMQEMRKDMETKVDAVLNDKQKARMKEIRLQVRGTAALTDKEVAESLKLTDDQVNKIKDLNKTLADARTEAFSGGGRPDADAIAKLTKLRTETNDKIVAVLNSDQKASFEKMQGAKIEGLPAGGFGAGAGGGRRNRGGGN